MSKKDFEDFDFGKVMRRTVAIRATETHCLLTVILEQGGLRDGWRSTKARYSTKPLYIETIDEAVAVAKKFLSGKTKHLASYRDARKEEITGSCDPSRNVWIESARNGWVIGVSIDSEKGRNQAWGDKVVCVDVDDVIDFCVVYLKNLKGANWWEDPDCTTSITRRKGMVEISVNQESIGFEGVIVEPIEYPQCWWDRVSSGDLRWAAPAALSRIIEDDHLNTIVVPRDVADEIKAWCEAVDGWEFEPGKTCLIFEDVVEDE